MPDVSFSIPSHAEAVRWACLAVRGILEGIRMSQEDKYFVELAVSEATTNVVRHAYGDRPDQVIVLDVAVETGRLVVTISDTGASLDPARMEEAALPSGDVPEEMPGGRGLFLMHEAMDEVRLSRIDGRNVLTMTKRHAGVK